MMTLCRHSTRARSDPRLTTKPKAKLTVLVVGIVVLVMIGTVAEIGSSGDTVETGAITDNKKSQSQAATRPEDADSTFEATPNSENCLSEGLLETHPMIMDEIKRLDPFLINSESMAVYRGLTELQLLPLVDQGDSGAMAVLGAMHVMRFRGLPDSSAIPYLLLEDLRRQQSALLDEIQQIADRYHWSEAEIVALPAWRRARYLSGIHAPSRTPF